MVKAMVSKVSPNAKATPAKPIPRFGNAAAKTALPQPPNTSQNVPKNSAKQRLLRVIEGPPVQPPKMMPQNRLAGGHTISRAATPLLRPHSDGTYIMVMGYAAFEQFPTLQELA
jgi:hypothetical protein